MKKLEYIDALRGIAVLAVLMVHTGIFSQVASSSYTFNNIVQEGARGVQLFYVVSALTLFLSFDQRSQSEKKPIRNFFLRRFFRIAPLFYLSVIFYLFFYGIGPRYWLGTYPNITIANIISNFTFMQGFNPYWINSIVPGGWSIAVEMMFYLILPLLFKMIKNLNQALKFFVVSILIRLGFLLVLKNNLLISDSGLWQEYLLLFFPSQLPVFSIGIILFFIIFKTTEGVNWASAMVYFSLSLIILFQLLLPDLDIFPNYLVFGVFFLFLVMAMQKSNSILLSNIFTRFIGKISFSMYLVHFGVLELLKSQNLIHLGSNEIISYFITFVFTVAISTAISFVTFKIIELPTQLFCKKLILKLESASGN